MKIRQDLRKQLNTSRIDKQTKRSDTSSFHHVMQSQTFVAAHDSIKQQLEDIEHQGDRVARFRTFRELATFKRLVKAFIKEVSRNGFDLKQTTSFQLNGRSRPLTLVQEVDEKLVELTEAMMHQAERSVDLLGIIGEIKGLLVDFVF